MIGDRAVEIERENGEAAAAGFFKVARGTAEPLEPLSERWLSEIAGDVKEQTASQHPRGTP